jgi:uncharacterized protein YceK
VRFVLIAIAVCASSTLLHGCSSGSKTQSANTSRQAQPSTRAMPNTTDIISVDQRAGTFVALSRRDHTTERIVARCGTVCPSLGKNFAGFWSLPASQVAFEVINVTETEGLKTE